NSGDPLDEALRALDWWYPEDEHGEPQMEAVLAEINGWYTLQEKENVQRSTPNAQHSTEEGTNGAVGIVLGSDREGNAHHGPQVDGYPQLKDDGSTASGCWIYSGVLGPDGKNRALIREPKDFLGHGWGFAWPGDRRILYNRASAD